MYNLTLSMSAISCLKDQQLMSKIECILGGELKELPRLSLVLANIFMKRLLGPRRRVLHFRTIRISEKKSTCQTCLAEFCILSDFCFCRIDFYHYYLLICVYVCKFVWVWVYMCVCSCVCKCLYILVYMCISFSKKIEQKISRLCYSYFMLLCIQYRLFLARKFLT